MNGATRSPLAHHGLALGQVTPDHCRGEVRMIELEPRQRMACPQLKVPFAVGCMLQLCRQCLPVFSTIID